MRHLMGFIGQSGLRMDHPDRRKPFDGTLHVSELPTVAHHYSGGTVSIKHQLYVTGSGEIDQANIEQDFGIRLDFNDRPPYREAIAAVGDVQDLLSMAADQAAEYKKLILISNNVPMQMLNGPARVADALSHPGAVGRLSQVCDRWIYTSCLCFGLDREEQRRSGFGYGYSVYQVGYSRNLLFGNGARMDRVFDTIVDRTRSRLDVPQLKTVFGAKARPRRDRASGPPRLEAALETPRYDLTIFKLHFGRLTLKAYTNGERVLRFEAITHNTAELRCGRALERFGEIVTRLAGMAERFTTMLDCVDIGFIPDQFLDRLPAPSQIGATRVGGIDLNRPRTRAALHAARALAAAPGGFTVKDLAAKVQAMTGHTDYTIRQAAYDLRRLRGKHLVAQPGRSRHSHVPAQAARTIAALLTLRDQVIAPILAGVRSPRMGRKPAVWTAVDRDYEQLRIHMHTLFDDLGITTGTAAA
jgi:hypothetical protein